MLLSHHEDPISAYRENIERKVRECYDLAQRARSQGRDVTDRVEIPLASDMADRVEELISIPGIAAEIRELGEKMSREEVAIEMARRVASRLSGQGTEAALDKAVRVGLAILTEGILVAPLEGIGGVYISKNDDGSTYAGIVYAGPIRGAGGTAQALSVLIGDVVRRELGIGRFLPTEDEIERYIEEVQAYNRVKHLQYMPTAEEIKLVIQNSPICIDGEGSEEEEVSGHRDMKRIRTNRIRGGMCLVLCEGLIQKAKKVLKYTNALRLEEWNFLSQLTGKKEDGSSEKKSEKFLKDLIAGRPVFTHPGRPGGFRLRYGRSRVSGLAAVSLNPATMYVMDKFIAIGSQLKLEMPGKAGAITPCDEIDGPMVRLSNGDHVRIDRLEDAKMLENEITEITDAGEILISYGDFLENNHVLETPSFTAEWWRIYASRFPELSKYVSSRPGSREAVEISVRYGVPLHPAWDYFWHDISVDELRELRDLAMASRVSGEDALMDARAEDTLVKLGVEFRKVEGGILVRDAFALFYSMGLRISGGSVEKFGEIEGKDAVECVNRASGIAIKPRAPTRVGARMGRPEKAGDRKMKPMVHVLFPVENYGDTRRSIKNAGKTGTIKVEVQARSCRSCGYQGPQPLCPECGSTTSPVRTTEMDVDLDLILRRAEERLSIDLEQIGELKGVKKLMSRNRVCEPIEKGILRAYHGISTNKDGTARFDMTDIPITHFRPEEIGVSRERLQELGYRGDGILELYPQDIIIPRQAAEYLLRVARFVDDLLVKYYGMEPYYMCESADDLIGHLVIGLAPHTSGGIVGRIIGFSDVSACYAHPLFHAAKRRNCDGDEDSVMLLMDGLLNFSREFLPSTTGGLMDAPLVLTVNLRPDEVDKEAMNLDTMWEYPEEFYLAAERHAMPSEIEGIMKPYKKFIAENGTYYGIGYTHDTRDISEGVKVSSYKTIESMEEKISMQLGLASKLRAVDVDDVAARVLESHFLPDIFGNFRRFFSQEFRCTKCNTKYRRVPLSGKCLRCGNPQLTLTIHRGSIVKYMDETIKMAEKYNLPWYLKMRIDNLVKTIEGTFGEEERKEVIGLEAYQGR